MTPSIRSPEFCPNPGCRFYDRSEAASCRWYTRIGRFYTQCRGWIPRFRCKYCRKTCSTQTFSIHYWTHSTHDLERLLALLYSSSGLRQIARFSGVTYRVIQNRVRRLARNSLSVMDLLLSQLSLSENLAFDGFESFTRSQYHPNNITTVVGADSQLLYALIHTLLRRKGRMSEHQKAMRSLIDQHWSLPPAATGSDCTTLFSDLAPIITDAAKRCDELTLFSDAHRAYPPALNRVSSLKQLLDAGTLVHHRISSRKARTTQNPLFPVNYLDRQIRKNMGEHVRETVKQGREVNCQMERMAVFMYMHNFCTPHRIGDEADCGQSPTHFQIINHRSKKLHKRLKRFLTHRHLWGHCELEQEWMKRIWHHRYENPPALRVSKEGKVLVRTVALGPRQLPMHFLA
jgi:transposase-like protein